MTVSLPHMFVAGLLAAPVGALLLLAQFWWPHRTVFFAGLAGGFVAWLSQQYILHAIDQDFIGWYKPAFWAVAFLAGYAAVAIVAYTAVLLAARLSHKSSASPP